jgi:hypothetical protein
MSVTLEIILLLVVIKLPIIAWLMWMPFRGGEGSAEEPEPDEGSEESGGGGGGGGPRRRPPHHRPPLPHLSRRGGPHGGRTASPRRVRSVVGRPVPVRSAR